MEEGKYFIALVPGTNICGYCQSDCDLVCRHYNGTCLFRKQAIDRLTAAVHALADLDQIDEIRRLVFLAEGKVRKHLPAPVPEHNDADVGV